MLLFHLALMTFAAAEYSDSNHPEQCKPKTLNWDKMIKSGPTPKTSIDFTFNPN